ncbi:hypothetical protein MVES1_000405 [Malassezia vespertilionis]|uniref:Mrpl22p n=1 Tax=Malassezia vespertilionis TaxID=2020962 RepID=A0A2N1JGS8_9BASI|nr:uncharacterized protein MVES1_000405 [Malassezia vespertilionis]PKI85750.1 hypothetical protein MVES_000381 [Malassezia vespertilionis]WFD05079.1 hypothetical protein MVES1_000405 [Malassezia vespertilionis]
MLGRVFASVSRAPRVSLVQGMRMLHTTPRSLGFWDNIIPLIQGNRRERQLQRKQGGLLPQDMARIQAEQKEDTMMAAQSSTGDSLVDDVIETPHFRNKDLQRRLQEEKRQKRLLRKRWGGIAKLGGEDIQEHKYSTAVFRISPRKLKLLANQISGMPIDYAIVQMQFSSKRAARRIRSTLAMARDHAVAKGMDSRSLIVSEAWVNKGTYMARLEIKGRGRMGVMHHPQARMHIVLRPGNTLEQREAQQLDIARRRVQSMGSGGVTRTNRKFVNGFQHPGWAW